MTIWAFSTRKKYKTVIRLNFKQNKNTVTQVKYLADKYKFIQIYNGQMSNFCCEFKQ